MKLSPHFQLEEFTRSETAKRLKIDNTPTNEEVKNLQVLCIYLLEPLRNYLGRPIIITSGYRSAKLNKAVGGATSSYHIRGMAADIRIASVDEAKKAGDFLVKLDKLDQVILEVRHNAMWLHIGWALFPRHEFFTIDRY